MHKLLTVKIVEAQLVTVDMAREIRIGSDRTTWEKSTHTDLSAQCHTVRFYS